jgi:hypothetical protein
VDCQACESKKQVVKPMRNSLYVRECFEEVISLGETPVEATYL